MAIFSPLEQFQILPIMSISLGIIELDISNITLSLLCFFISFVVIVYLLKNEQNYTLYIIPEGAQYFLLQFYLGCKETLQENLNLRYYEHGIFPFIFCLAFFLVTLNVGSSVPMSMCLTSQVAVVGSICIATFFGLISFGLYYRGLTFLRTFYAPGTTLFLGMGLVPIEFIAYCFKPLSIFCRLCANLMSGHAILKVLVGAIFSLPNSMSGGLFVSLMTAFLVVLLVPLFMLEFLVYIIQAYVFIVLVCLFFRDTMGHYHRH